MINYKQRYQDYLKSPHWKRFKKEYYMIFPEPSCYCCGRPWCKKLCYQANINRCACEDLQDCVNYVPIDLHHKNYECLYKEDVWIDVIPVCRLCHEEIHDRVRLTKNGCYSEYEYTLSNAHYLMRDKYRPDLRN